MLQGSVIASFKGFDRLVKTGYGHSTRNKARELMGVGGTRQTGRR